jgi:hypothetical protein
MEYPTFDWDNAEKKYRPEHVAWMRENHNKPITEEEFVAYRKSLRASDTRGSKAKRYSTARLRGQYRRLKEKYGFFV